MTAVEHCYGCASIDNEVMGVLVLTTGHAVMGVLVLSTVVSY